MSGALALPTRLSDLIDEYEEKRANLPLALEIFESAGRALIMAAEVQGTYGQSRIETGSNHLSTLNEHLRRSAWLTIYGQPGMKIVMSAKDQSRFEAMLTHPPEFTVENIKEQFGEFVLNPRENILRGLAEVFGDLDQSFKSHERVKVGAKGLPKRIIISGFGGYSSYGWKKLTDVVNALASFQGDPILSEWEIQKALQDNGEHFKGSRGFELRLFGNGNGHVHFSKDTLENINRALAEFYGEVLADEFTARPVRREQSKEVSKDLQYYPTPENIVDRVLSGVRFEDKFKVLEPSCGCGRILDGIRKAAPLCTSLGIEADPARAAEARAKGHAVQCANFLEEFPLREYDLVIMNPPFYGKHYAKHVSHAMNFLKPGGRLYSILPITAKTDHGLIDAMGFWHQWEDLPIGSFRESGTNIHTTVLTMRADV